MAVGSRRAGRHHAHRRRPPGRPRRPGASPTGISVRGWPGHRQPLPRRVLRRSPAGLGLLVLAVVTAATLWIVANRPGRGHSGRGASSPRCAGPRSTGCSEWPVGRFSLRQRRPAVRRRPGPAFDRHQLRPRPDYWRVAEQAASVLGGRGDAGRRRRRVHPRARSTGRRSRRPGRLDDARHHGGREVPDAAVRADPQPDRRLRPRRGADGRRPGCRRCGRWRPTSTSPPEPSPRAYTELEAGGADREPPADRHGGHRAGTPKPAQDGVRAAAAHLAAQARDAGVDAETVLAIVRAALVRSVR